MLLNPHLSLGNHPWKGPPCSEASSLPRPHTLASPPVYSLGLQGCHLARESLSSFLLPAGTCPVWEQHVPGSNPDAGEAPAWSTWWQTQRQCHGSAAFTPRPKLLGLVAPGLRTPLSLGLSLTRTVPVPLSWSPSGQSCPRTMGRESRTRHGLY